MYNISGEHQQRASYDDFTDTASTGFEFSFQRLRYPPCQVSCECRDTGLSESLLAESRVIITHTVAHEPLPRFSIYAPYTAAITSSTGINPCIRLKIYLDIMLKMHPERILSDIVLKFI